MSLRSISVSSVVVSSGQFDGSRRSRCYIRKEVFHISQPMVSDNTTTALIWGSVATGVVSLLSLSGACVLPLITGSSRQRWMQFFIAMAVSTLSADVFLHLLPEILGIHHHHEKEHDDHHQEHNDSSHNHSHTEEVAKHWYSLNEERDRLIWMSIVLLAVYLVYLFEFSVFYRKRHTHHPEKVAHCPAHDEQRISAGSTGSDVSLNSKKEEERSEREETVTKCCGLTSRAIIILFGDAIHNFVDGVAIGTSFLNSTQLGLVTSIAVVCHELPHELGDLAVLLDSGLSLSRSLLLNLVSALTAFLGLYLSIILQSQIENAVFQRALLCLTAGMFLYVAWIDMLSHLKHDSPPEDHWLLVLCLQYAGFLVGFLIIFTIGWFEHDLFRTDHK